MKLYVYLNYTFNLLINLCYIIQVSFKNGDKDKDAQFGEELTPTIVKDPPSLAWYTEDAAHYTVVMVGKYLNEQLVSYVIFLFILNL